jgi:hypothetical protein
MGYTTALAHSRLMNAAAFDSLVHSGDAAILS